MDNNEKDIYSSLRETIQKQLAEAYKEGAKEGAIITCTTIYRIMKTWGLEESNILYTILKEIATTNGCDNLEQKVKDIQNIAATSKNEIPS